MLQDNTYQKHVDFDLKNIEYLSLVHNIVVTLSALSIGRYLTVDKLSEIERHAFAEVKLKTTYILRVNKYLIFDI